MSGARAPSPPAEDYARLRPGGSGAAVRGRAALIWVEGPDAEGFLHGLLSNDVAGLAPVACCRALPLDAKGHLQADLRVRRDGPDAFTVGRRRRPATSSRACSRSTTSRRSST